MLLEFVPFLAGSRPRLPERPQGAAPLDEELVRGDHLLGEHGRVTARRVEVQMAERGGGDVQRQAAGDRSVVNSRRKPSGVNRLGCPAPAMPTSAASSFRSLRTTA